MPRIAALSEELEKKGIPVLAITQDAPEEAESYLTQGGWDITVLYDGWNEAAGALNSWGTPQYFVLDGSGHLRFSHSSLGTLPRQVAALRAK